MFALRNIAHNDVTFMIIIQVSNKVFMEKKSPEEVFLHSNVFSISASKKMGL